MKKIVVAICVGLILSLAKAEVLKGYFSSSVTELEQEPVGDSPSPVSVTLPLDPNSNSAIFEHEGDMTFVVQPGDDSNHRRRRNAVSSTRFLWEDGVIPYEISSVFDENERRVILMGMKHWEDDTCIRFRPKRAADRTSIFLMSGGPRDCSSFVGHLYFLTRRPQGISLGPGCVVISTVIHELGHAIGFYHEHNRPDRDDYISIRTGVGAGLASQLERLSSSNTLKLGYDYASIMHYSSLGGIITARSDVPFGNAEELSPLDIAKARRLYRCDAPHLWPPASTVVPPKPVTSLPPGENCGQVIVTKERGTFRFPGYPTHRRQGNCNYVIEAPKGYDLVIKFPNFPLSSSFLCSSEYVQLFDGSTLAQTNRIYFYRFPRGRICGSAGDASRYSFSSDSNVLTIHYHTDNSNAHALQVDYSVIDRNECTGSLCHQCTNLPGTFRCSCRDGYYHSPAANTCYDVNECAYNNGGCLGRCINSAGSYSCACQTGLFLQADGISCGRNRPAVIPRPQTPGTVNPVPRLTTTTPPTTTLPTTPPVTTPLATPSITSNTCPTPRPSSCGGVLTESLGTFHSPNWPDKAYPLNLNCEWTIECPGSNKLVNLVFDSRFLVAGKQPECLKDTVEVVDCANDVTYGPYCYTTRPESFRGLGNSARVRFITKALRGILRIGFGVTYTCTDGPTTQPATTPTAPPTTQPTTRPTTPRPTTQITVRPISSTETTMRPTTPRPTDTTMRPTTQSTAVSTATSPISCSLLEIPDLPSDSTTLACAGVIRPGTTFGKFEVGYLPSANITQCIYYMPGVEGTSYQLRLRYLDFPNTSCEYVSLVIYEGFSTNSPIHRRICGDQSNCDEVIIPLPGQSFIAQFVVRNEVTTLFRGFIAVFEEV